MAHIVEVIEENGQKFEQCRHIPGETRVLKELRRIFPGAHLVKCDLIPPGVGKAVPCVELRYNVEGSREAAPIAAVPVTEDRNATALTPLTLLRHAVNRLGFDLAVKEIVSRQTLDRIWEFTYNPITKPPDAASTAAPDPKES